MRLYGKRRLPTLQWMWAPWLGEASLEMTAASLQDSFSLGLAELRVDGPRPLRGRPASAAHPGGLVTATIAGPQRLVHARAWAEPEAMVGYVYRDTDGRDLMVAQSDSGSAQLEVWTRKLPGAPWHLIDDQRSGGGVAVEIHQHEALPGVTYLGWDGVASDAEVAVAATAASDAEVVAWPELGDIVALGLTYADHVRETGGTPSVSAPIAAFRKLARSFVRDDGAYPLVVPTPTAAQIAAVAAELDPELATRLGGAPAVMDYEGEVALVALGPSTSTRSPPERRSRSGSRPRTISPRASCRCSATVRPIRIATGPQRRASRASCRCRHACGRPRAASRRCPSSRSRPGSTASAASTRRPAS